MRTDSNTALSPILNTPSKKSAQVKSSAENGSAFANDLNKSIQVLADKNNASKTTGSSSSSTVNVPISADSSSQSSISMKENGDQVSLPVTSEQVEAATLSEKSAVALTETSGKTLHSNGDSLPINADGSKKMMPDDVVSGDLVKATPVSQSPVTDAPLMQDAENTSDNLHLANGTIVKKEVSSSTESAESAKLKSPVTAVSLTQDAENTPDNLHLANAATIKKEVDSNAESAKLKSPVTAVSLTHGAENTPDNLHLANGAIVKKEVSSTESAELKSPVTAVSLTQDAENTSDNLHLANGTIVKTEVSSNAENAELKGPVTAVSLTQDAENTSDNLHFANGAIVKKEVSSSTESAESAKLKSPVTAVSLTQDAENTPDNLHFANGTIVKKEVSSSAESAKLKSPVTAVSLTQGAENTPDNLHLANGAIVKKEVSSSTESAELKSPVTAVSLTQGAENTPDNLHLANGAIVKKEVSSSAESAESDISEVDGSKLVVLDKDVPLIDPKEVSQVATELGITHSEDANHESVDELNWVLAQMGMSKTRVASPSEATAVKAQVVSEPMVSTNYNARLQTPSLSLLNESLVQNDSLAGSVTDVVLEEGVVIDQPIELRKKEQEAMLTRMMPTLNADSSQENRLGDMSTMLQNSNRLSPTVLTANGLPQAATPSLAMSVPPGHPGWAGEMTQKVAWVARDGGHTAHIRLDPPELGSLTVKVSVDSDSNTQINFVAATPQARDMLESQMGRLREMLAQQGMDLSRADVDVSQQDASGAEQRESSRGGRPVVLNDEGDDTELFSNKTSYVSSSGVDYYA